MIAQCTCKIVLNWCSLVIKNLHFLSFKTPNILEIRTNWRKCPNKVMDIREWAKLFKGKWKFCIITKMVSLFSLSHEAKERKKMSLHCDRISIWKVERTLIIFSYDATIYSFFKYKISLFHFTLHFKSAYRSWRKGRFSFTSDYTCKLDFNLDKWTELKSENRFTLNQKIFRTNLGMKRQTFSIFTI